MIQGHRVWLFFCFSYGDLFPFVLGVYTTHSFDISKVKVMEPDSVFGGGWLGSGSQFSSGSGLGV